MRDLGLRDAATPLLSEALRRNADRPAELLRALRYEPALACGGLSATEVGSGRSWRLYAEALDYEDGARRRGDPDVAGQPPSIPGREGWDRGPGVQSGTPSIEIA